MDVLIGVLIIGMPIALLISGIIYLLTFHILKKRKICGIRQLIFFLLIISFILISIATIFLGGIRFNSPYHFLNLRPFIWMTPIHVVGFNNTVDQLILNVLMFIPPFLLLPMASKSFRCFWKAILCATSVTLCIETIQYFTGRSADIDDVIMNVLGGVIGYGIFKILSRIAKNKNWWNKAIGEPLKK